MNNLNRSSIIEVTMNKILEIIDVLSPYKDYASTAYKLLQYIFGTSGANLSTEELYKNINKLVKDENTRQSIQEKLADVSTATNYLKIDYASKKDDTSYTAVQKEQDLKNNILPLSQSIEFFKSEKVDEQAINEFILAANIALMYYKEMAEIYKGDDVKYKARYNIFKKYLAGYLSHGKTIAINILNKRQSQITQIKRVSYVIDESPYVYYSFEDKFANAKYDLDAVLLGENKAKEQAENLRADVINSIKDSMENIFSVINAWENLDRLDYMKIIKTEAFGDPTTNMFDDLKKANRIKRLSISYGCVIDGITVYYDDFAIHHGGYVPNPVEVKLENGDYIVEVYGYYEPWGNQNEISLLKFKTKNGKTYGPYGRRPYSNHTYLPIDPKHEFVLKGDLGQEICAFFGANSFDNKCLSRIGCYYHNS